MRVMAQVNCGTDNCLCLDSCCCEGSAEWGTEVMGTLLSGHIHEEVLHTGARLVL